MRAVNSVDWTITPAVPDPGQSGPAVDDLLATAACPREDQRRGWQHVIDNTLIEWGRDPSQLEDEDVVPPSRAIIDQVNRLAIKLRDSGCPAPDRVVPNGDGGIVLEWWEGRLFETVEVLDDMSVEVAAYDDHRLISRETHPAVLSTHVAA